MLKEIVICIIIVSMILIGNYITQNYTKQSISELTGELSNIRNKVIQENIENEKIKEDVKSINKKWKEKYNKLAYYIEHNELEKIETELTAIKSKIETAEIKNAVKNIDKSIFLLKNVRDRYAFNLENIF